MQKRTSFRLVTITATEEGIASGLMVREGKRKGTKRGKRREGGLKIGVVKERKRDESGNGREWKVEGSEWRSEGNRTERGDSAPHRFFP